MKPLLLLWWGTDLSGKLCEFSTTTIYIDLSQMPKSAQVLQHISNSWFGRSLGNFLGSVSLTFRFFTIMSQRNLINRHMEIFTKHTWHGIWIFNFRKQISYLEIKDRLISNSSSITQADNSMEISKEILFKKRIKEYILHVTRFEG